MIKKSIRKLLAPVVLLAVVLSLAAPGVYAESTAPIESGWSESNITAPPMDSLFDDHVRAESDRYIGVYLQNTAAPVPRLADPSLYTIQSGDDPNYKSDKAVHPDTVSVKSRLTRLSLRKTLLVKTTAVYLHLAVPLSRGKTYQVVVVLPDNTPSPALSSFKFDDCLELTDDIKVNQLGYLPGTLKHAYLGLFIGTAGGLPFEPQAFSVINEEGVPVFLGKPVRRAVHEELVGEQVYELDFSSLETPGRYRIYVAGVGISYPFSLGDEAWNPAYVNLMRGLYHQRCGAPVDAAFSRFHRDACHLDDAFVSAAAGKLKFAAPKNPPHYDIELPEGRHPAIHGHHDAGDYGKYTCSGARFVANALQAMEVYPDHFREDNLSLPNSGNGIPDLLEEVKWELDWLESMQDTDGGVFGVIRPNDGGYENSMPPAKNHRLFFPKDTLFTASFAAALAHAAADPDMQKFYPQDAKRYLSKAVLAWDWLDQNTRYVGYFQVDPDFGDWDKRCWAAVELYAATGEAKYHDYFLKHFDPNRKRWGWVPLYSGIGNAITRYVFLTQRSTDAAMLERCKKAYSEACEVFVADSQASAYRLSMPSESIKAGSYGWMFPGSDFSYPLILGAKLFNKPAYLQVARDNLDFLMGENPAGYFLDSSGMGYKRNIELVSNPSIHDNIVEPIPGLPSGAGSANFYWLNNYGSSAGKGQFPDAWPFENRWYDGFNVNTEFTSSDLVREVVATGFFAKLPAKALPRPSVKLIADTISGPAPLTVHFHSQSDTPGGRARFVFWDFDDESFSCQANPTHVFKDDGKLYKIAVTIIDDQGALAYQEAQVRCVRQNVTQPTVRFEPDDRTSLLVPFDTSLCSVVRNKTKPTFDVGHAGLIPSHVEPIAPHWMASPSGGCLIMDGGEQLRWSLPSDAVHANKGFTLEAMMYVTGFCGWGWDHGDTILFGLSQGKSESIGFRQTQWGKSPWPSVSTAIDPMVADAAFPGLFPMEKWVHVVLDSDGSGHTRLVIDGKAVATVQSVPLSASNSEPINVILGPIRGMVSELRLSDGIRYATTSATSPAVGR